MPGLFADTFMRANAPPSRGGSQQDLFKNAMSNIAANQQRAAEDTNISAVDRLGMMNPGAVRPFQGAGGIFDRSSFSRYEGWKSPAVATASGTGLMGLLGGAGLGALKSLLGAGDGESKLPGLTPPSPDTPEDSARPVGMSTSKNSAIAQAALNYRGSNTSAGPDRGNLACVWAVNRVFERAGLETPWRNSNSTADALSALQNPNVATEVQHGQEQPGDIVIGRQGGRGHIGISTGRNQVLSNSSSTASFRWMSDTRMGGNYGQTRIFRLR